MGSHDLSFTDFAAETFLSRLQTQRFRTHNKHIIDDLPEAERRALFEGLMQRNTVEKPVEIRGEWRRLWFVEADGFDVLPFLVVDEDDAIREKWERNAGSEGFASSLRDYYSLGAEEDEIRLLVTLTPAGNETQKSAQDRAVDRQLLSRELLCRELVDHHDAQGDERLDEIVSTYLDYVRDEPWNTTLQRLDGFLDAIELDKPETWGRKLNLLGCFMRDTSPQYASGEPKYLPRDAKKNRIGDKTRLQHNAAAKRYLDDLFENPAVEVQDELDGTWKDDAVSEITEKGASEVGDIDVDSLDQPEDKANVSDNEFEWTKLDVRGAKFHHLTTGSDNTHLLLVAAPGEFDVVAPLQVAWDGEHHYGHLFEWDEEKERPNSIEGRAAVSDGNTELEFHVDPDKRMTVMRAAISGGPRSYKRFQDEFLIVAYKTDEPAVAWETGLELTLEYGAWVREGREATFKIKREGQEPVRRDVAYTSMETEYDPGDDDSVESAELEAVLDSVRSAVLHGGGLPVRVCWVEAMEQRTDTVHRLLEDVPYAGHRKDQEEFLEKLREGARDAKRGGRYLDAVTDVSWDPEGHWTVVVADSVRVRVAAWNEYGQESSAGRFLANPGLQRLHIDEGGESKRWEHPTDLGEEYDDFLAERQEIFGILAEEAPVRATDEEEQREALSILLTNLPSMADAIDDYYGAWLEAVNGACSESTDYTRLHRGLLQTDTVARLDENGDVKRLIVLPTHPWLLRSLLGFQTYLGEAFRTAENGRDLEKLITQDEVHQFVPSRIVEDWFVEQKRLRAEDSAPFHLEFLPDDRYRASASLDYVTRVVRNKISRYLTMHRHLQHSRRTLRIGFVNPGDGAHLFKGIREWLKRSNDRYENFEEWLGDIPDVELLLFSDDKQDGQRTGAAFDRYFREHIDQTPDREIDQALLSKVRYGRRGGGIPDRDEDYVHICFAHGLVDSDGYNSIDGKVDDGWDGCFGGGLMATSLRQTVSGVDEKEGKKSKRGLWVVPLNEDPQREGLAQILALLRGAKFGRVSPDLAIYWQVDLPTLESLTPMYDNSDWVVHLDRELGLEMFREFEAHGPKIIEYSDQEDPQNPGFDVVTLTKHAEPYLEQLGEVLKLADLRAERDGGDEATKASNELLDDINILSGSWALDFLMGNIAQPRLRNRLKGNVGSALVYRWLERMERQEIEERFGEDVVPVYVSLEELIRATPAVNLPVEDGLVSRYSNEGAGTAGDWCDDLLVLYLTPADREREYRIFGRIIEVKFGTTANQRAEQGVKQVKGTQELLRENLAGGRENLDAPFRHRQLSLLIKSQLEQALSSGIINQSQWDALNLPALSAHLASGNYNIDYFLKDQGTQFRGDVFLLSTDGRDDASEAKPKIRDAGAARVIEMDLELLRWLAFSRENPRTLHSNLRDTLPILGSDGANVEDRLRGGGTDSAEDDGGGDSGPSTGWEVATESGPSSESSRNAGSQSVSKQVPAESGAQSRITNAGSRGLGVLNGSPSVQEIQRFLEDVLSGDMNWERYSERMREFTGDQEAPGGNPWSRDRILDFFEEFGFSEESGEILYDGSTEDAAEGTHSDPETGEESLTASIPQMPLEEAIEKPIKDIEVDRAQMREILDRLDRAFSGQNIDIEAPPSIDEIEVGPRLLRVYVRLSPSENISSVRNRSEDIARLIGTTTSDIHIMNVPERRSVALDLPMPDVGYQISFDDLHQHPSFDAAAREMDLGFCAGIDVTGKPNWVDLAPMPHALVAGTTGSGKTVFLRSVVMSLILAHEPTELDVRLSSSKPMDFKIFTRLEHASRRAMAESPSDTLHLVRELVEEMDRRIELLSEAYCDDLSQYNSDSSVDGSLPRIVAVIDEYAETVLSFSDSSKRSAFEDAVGRLAQKARAAGIHLILCMQRPDSNVLQGAVKSNILHRFALKLPQNHDSRVILDEAGAEALLGKGDMLYKDAAGKVHRLQVPYLDGTSLKNLVRRLEG